MQLAKEGKTIEILGGRDILGIEDMITFMVYFYQSTLLDREDWLTKQETQFFIATVMIANKGIKYTSPEAKRILKDIFNLRRQSDVRGYLIRMEEKGWLRSNKRDKSIQLLEFFKMDLEEVELSLNVQLNFKND